MATGISSFLANELLDHAFRNSSWTPPATVYAQAHSGDPGAAGTANVAETTRQAIAFSAAASGSISNSSTPEFTLTGTRTVSHVSYWTAASGGNFLASVAASASKSGTSGDIIRVNTAAISFTPIA